MPPWWLSQAKKENNALKTDLAASRLAYNKSRMEMAALIARDNSQKEQIGQQAARLKNLQHEMAIVNEEVPQSCNHEVIMQS